jgi:hypothetical protein
MEEEEDQLEEEIIGGVIGEIEIEETEIDLDQLEEEIIGGVIGEIEVDKHKQEDIIIPHQEDHIKHQDIIITIEDPVIRPEDITIKHQEDHIKHQEEEEAAGGVDYGEELEDGKK